MASDDSHPNARPRLTTNTVWALVADGAQLVLSLVAFFLLARQLGDAEFGVFTTVIALSTFAIPVFSFGAQQLLMLDMQQGTSFRELWPRAVVTVFLGGLFGTGVATLLQPFVVEELPRLEFGVLFASQAVFFAISEFALVSSQAHRQLSVAAALRVAAGVIRLVAVGLFIRAGAATTADWAWYALASWTIAAVVGLAIVRRVYGASPFGAAPSFGELRRGIPYATGTSSAFALDALDRPMLLNLRTAAETGVYGAGYRLVQMGVLPIHALVRATDADFFAAGAAGPGAAKRLARRMSMLAFGYGIAAAVIIFLGAPLVPVLLGDSWAESTDVVRFLALLPLIKAMQIFAANALTGSGHQSDRLKALRNAIAVNFVMNLALIPAYGWKGAVAATFGGELVMAISLWRSVNRVAATGSPGSADGSRVERASS